MQLCSLSPGPIDSHRNEDVMVAAPAVTSHSQDACLLPAGLSKSSFLANQSLGLPGLCSPQANREEIEKEGLHEVTSGPVFYCGRKVGSTGV